MKFLIKIRKKKIYYKRVVDIKHYTLLFLLIFVCIIEVDPYFRFLWNTTMCLFAKASASQHTAYDFSFLGLTTGNLLPLSDYKGKVILVVNTASKCGFTGQYAGLETLYNTYKDRGLVIIGVPSNDFGEQEKGHNEEIATFCQINFGVTFPMAAKEIVSGENAHPFYKWAQDSFPFWARPRWNFHKYLIDTQGHMVDYFYSTTTPESSRMRKAIEHLLSPLK